jgi:hypothetical protein
MTRGIGKSCLQEAGTWALVPGGGPVQVQLALAGVVHGRAAIAHRAVPVVLRLGQVLPLAPAVEGDLRRPMET